METATYVIVPLVIIVGAWALLKASNLDGHLPTSRTASARTVVCLAGQPDLDEKLISDPLTGEEVLRRHLDAAPTDDYEDDRPEVPEDSDT